MTACEAEDEQDDTVEFYATEGDHENGSAAFQKCSSGILSNLLVGTSAKSYALKIKKWIEFCKKYHGGDLTPSGS